MTHCWLHGRNGAPLVSWDKCLPTVGTIGETVPHYWCHGNNSALLSMSVGSIVHHDWCHEKNGAPLLVSWEERCLIFVVMGEMVPQCQCHG